MWIFFYFSFRKKFFIFYVVVSFFFFDFNFVVREYILIIVIGYICCVCLNDMSVAFYYKFMRRLLLDVRILFVYKYAFKWIRIFNIVRMIINLY